MSCNSLRTGVALALLAWNAHAGTTVVNRAAGQPAAFGAAELRAAIAGHSLGRVVLAAGPDLGPEAFHIRKSGTGYRITGGGARGAMYGALEFAEQVQLTGRPSEVSMQPALAVRGLKFNIPLPGTGYLSEEDLAHNQWFWNLDYWRKFLDMAARNRYNMITFWSAHPYDRMVRIAKYPEATGIDAAELDRNVAFFRQLFTMAAERGLATYLVTWNIHVSRAFAQAHGIPDSGFDSPLVRDYQREAIKALFATYPMLTGLGTTAGERMGDLTVRQKLDWIADTYFAALRQVGRPVPFILRYWQAEPEALAAMLDQARYAAPIYLDIKYNGEHMYSSTRPHAVDPKWLQLAHGRYRLLWHLRNDDLFILRWGDPDFVRAVVRNMAGPDTAGFVEGSEIDVPGPDRIHTPDARAHLDWQYTFEKNWYRYMLWGRLGFFPDESDATWKAHFRRRFGAAGDDTFEALRQAGKIAPLITSYHWNYMNGDWYVEGSIGSWNTSYAQPRVNYRRAAMYQNILTYIFNNTNDPEYANIPEFLAGSRATGPLEVADRLEHYGRGTLAAIERAQPRVDRGQKEFACTAADMRAYGALGLYYAEKLRGAAYLARFLFGAGEAERQQAVAHLERALEFWRGVVGATEGHYLPHEVWLFGQFDWKRYLPGVAADVGIAREMQPFRSSYSLEGLHPWLEYTGGLLGRRFPEAAVSDAQEIALAARDAVSVTAPLAVRDGSYVEVGGSPRTAASDSITGLREFISPAASAIYRFDLPAGGRYALKVDCWWPHNEGGITVLVDESNMRTPVLRPPRNAAPASWTWQTVREPFALGAGAHTVRLVSRTPGARFGRLVWSRSK